MGSVLREHAPSYSQNPNLYNFGYSYDTIIIEKALLDLSNLGARGFLPHDKP